MNASAQVFYNIEKPAAAADRSYWCKYIEDWVSVKKKWGLAMDQEEVEAIKEGRGVCEKYKSGDALKGRHRP